MRYTYDEQADAAYLYLVEEIRPGEVKRSAWVPLSMKGASIMVSLSEDGDALGIEFLGVSQLFSPAAIDALRSDPPQRPES